MTRFYDWYENLPGDKRFIVFMSLLITILSTPVIAVLASVMIYGSSIAGNRGYATTFSLIAVALVGATRFYYLKVTYPRRVARRQ